MIKRKFGMAVLNISQGRFNSFSHKYLNAYDLCGMDSGIDRFRTFNDLEVIGVHEYSSTGFSNTVHFYDKENNITIAMTHMNTVKGYYVGKRFKPNDTIYYEGTKGNATGNHIHMEIGRGRQPQKTKISGLWQLKNLINIEDYFYIDKSYTRVSNAQGYKFSNTDYIEPFKTDTWLVCPKGQNIRASIMSKTVIASVPRGTELPVVGLIDGFQKDGYQWCEVDHNGTRGYAQIDTKFNWLKRR